MTLLDGRARLRAQRMAMVATFREPLCVAQCTGNMAQRGARFDPYYTHNCLLPKNLRRDIQ